MACSLCKSPDHKKPKCPKNTSSNLPAKPAVEGQECEEPIEEVNGDGFDCVKNILTFLTFAEFLAAFWDEQLEENDRQVLLDVDARHPDLIKKIENHLSKKMISRERDKRSVDSILQQIKTDEMIRSIFRKDPTRQTIHEKAQIFWTIAHKCQDLKKLAADNCGLCLSNGNLHTISKTNPRPNGATKTMDTYSSSTDTYGYYKYTGEDGGSQDNQRKDAGHYLKEASDYVLKNPHSTTKFEACLDGKYYTEKRLSSLNNLIPLEAKPRVSITSCASIIPKSGPV